jgi:hypothetical protein
MEGSGSMITTTRSIELKGFAIGMNPIPTERKSSYRISTAAYRRDDQTTTAQRSDSNRNGCENQGPNRTRVDGTGASITVL